MLRDVINKRYVYPRLGRAGLGNELFPVLRAAEYCEVHGTRMLPPIWSKPRIGPWLRGERDKRSYGKLFRRPPARLLALSALAEIGLVVKPGLVERHVVAFTGMANHYADLPRDPGWYRAMIANIATPDVYDDLSGLPMPFIAVHIRLGDFAAPVGSDAEPLFLANNNMSTPMSWFEHLVERVRAEFEGVSIIVCSDGSDTELSSLLSMPGVRRSPARNALADIELLAQSAGLIGSRSTFTAWGAFLGDVPLLVAPGGNAYSPHAKVWEVDGTTSPEAWLCEARMRM